MTGFEHSAAAVGVTLVVVLFACPLGIVVGLPIPLCLAVAFCVLVANGFYVAGCVVAVLMFTPEDVWAALLLKLERGFDRKRAGAPEVERPSGGVEDLSSSRSSRADRDGVFKPVGTVHSQKPATVLGLKSGFTHTDLDAARRRLAKLYHPDLHRDASRKTQKAMAEHMQAVNDAYEALKVTSQGR